MDIAIMQLAHVVQSDPDNRDALRRLCDALRTQGQLSTLAGLLEWWASVMNGHASAARALSGLYCRLAEHSSPEAARSLCIQALDLAPGSIEALQLFERIATREDAAALCTRYEAFLEQTPVHPESPRVRQRLIDMLVEAGQYDAALTHVRALPRRLTIAFGRDDIARACSIPPLGEVVDDGIEELDEFDIEYMEFEVELDLAS